jgi:hypothetical protein
MESHVTFLDCPAYLDKTGILRCGLPAEVEYRYLSESSDGPLESAKIMCPLGHWFNAPIESLTWHKDRQAASTSGAGTPARTAPTPPRSPGKGWSRH